MHDMTITITGCKKHTPKWETIQQVIRETMNIDGENNGRLTRISRRDGGTNYRDPGEYDLTFIPNVGDAITIALDIHS